MCEPLLHIEEQLKFVVMCILHLVIRIGDYLNKFIQIRSSLLTALKSWEFNSNALNCKSITKKFKRTFCPTIRSPYLLWLQFDAPEVLKNLHPWGCGMFSDDIVESLNYLFKDHFLCSSASGGGEGTRPERDTRLVTQA